MAESDPTLQESRKLYNTSEEKGTISNTDNNQQEGKDNHLKENGQEKQTETNNKEKQNIPTTQEEMDVTSVQPTSTEKDSQKPDHTCPTCTKEVRTGVHCGACDKWFHFKCKYITKEEVEEQYKEEEEYEYSSDRIKRNVER